MVLKRRGILLVAIVIATGCAQPRPDMDHPGDPEVLNGAWAFQLNPAGSRRSGSNAGPFVGTLVLVPTGKQSPPHWMAAGTFSVQRTGWLSRQPVADSAFASVDANGQVLIQIQIAGSCSDCGNLELVGQRNHMRIAGRWSQEVLGDGRAGSFTLVPVAKE
jgi:hypothetical protein